MVGLVSRLLIAKQIWDTLVPNRGLHGISDADRAWFMFGALGPAIGDFIPSGAPPAGAPAGATGPRSPYYSVWQNAFELAVGNPAKKLPDLVSTITTLQQGIDQLATIVANHDFGAARAFQQSSLPGIQTASNDLNTIISNFAGGAQLSTIGGLVGAGSRPAIDNTLVVVSPDQWTGREWLHWKQPGDFTVELLRQARATGDSNLIAYALGWQVCYATLVCGSGFMNSVAGTCYRTYWWRARWIANIVDAWNWGYYQYTGAEPITFNQADEPSVPYDQWPSLCAAMLHTWVDITGGAIDPTKAAQAVVEDDAIKNPLPTPLPREFTDFWMRAFNATYSGAAGSPFTAEGLQAGYLLNWLVLWFQTSGAVVGCNPEPPLGLVPCPQPTWATPGVNPQTGLPYSPAQPSPSWDPNVGESVCGFLAALLGVILTLCGGAAEGVGLIAGGVTAGVNGLEQLNWDQLACSLFWLKWYAYNQLFNLHVLSAVGGFQHPYPSELADFGYSTIVGLPALEADALWYYAGATYTCKSRAIDSMLMPWQPTGGADWIFYPPLTGTTFYPPGGAPTPATVPYFNPENPAETVWPYGAGVPGELYTEGWWPSAFVDDNVTNPPLTSIITPPTSYNAGTTSFGPAYQAALVLLEENPGMLPNWNLDGDRGLGWLTWQLTAPYPKASNPVQTEEEQI